MIIQSKYLWIAPIAVLAIGILPLPYDYYNFSRFVVSFCAAYFAFSASKQNKDILIWLFGALAVLYNPIIPVHLNEKSLWMIINIPTAIAFFYYRPLVDNKK